MSLNRILVLILMTVCLVSSAYAAEEIIEIEVPVYIECTPDNQSASGPTGADLPNNGPYRLVDLQPIEHSRNPLGHNNQYGNYTVSYLPSVSDVKRVNIQMNANRHPEVIQFFGWHGPRSWVHATLKFKFARTVPQEYLDEKAEASRAAVSSPVIAKYNTLKSTYELNVPNQLNHMNTALLAATDSIGLHAARTQYEHFVCPLLDEFEELVAEARGVDESLGTGIAEFLDEIKSQNKTEVEENIKATMNIIGSVGLLNDSTLTQPICTGYYTPVPAGYYRAQGTSGVYRLCDANYSGIKNPDVMSCLGGFAQVQDVPQATFNKITKNRIDGGHYAFNGFIRAENRCEVYRLYEDNKYCGVADPGQMERFGGWGIVKMISNYENLIEGRQYTGACQG